MALILFRTHVILLNILFIAFLFIAFYQQSSWPPEGRLQYGFQQAIQNPGERFAHDVGSAVSSSRHGDTSEKYMFGRSDLTIWKGQSWYY